MKNKLMSINIRKVDAASYLKRIGYRGPLTPHIDVLRRMHHRHLLTVPFENLDIHVGRPIILDERFFYEKIVENRRGGYCYELNGCFAWLLKRLGFKVSMLSARVARKEGGFSPDFDHLTLLVRLGERWLVDVGFGDLFTEPKRLDSAVAQQDKGEVYRIVSKGKTRLLLRRSADETTWKPQYAFTLRPRKLADFAARNRYQQTSPRSHFTQGRLISKLTPTGRVTLTDEKLILTERWKRVEHLVKDQGEFNRLLAKHFQLLLPRRGL